MANKIMNMGVFFVSGDCLSILDVVYSYKGGAKKDLTLEEFLEKIAKHACHCRWNPAQYANIVVIGVTCNDEYFIMSGHPKETIGALMEEYRDKKLQTGHVPFSRLSRVRVHNMEYTGIESLLLSAVVHSGGVTQNYCVLHPEYACLTLPELYVFIQAMKNMGMLKTTNNGAGRLLERYEELFAEERAKTEPDNG